MEAIDFKLPPGSTVRLNSLTTDERWWGEDEVLIDLPSGKSIDVGFYGNETFRVVVYQNGNFHDQVESSWAMDISRVIELVESYAQRHG